MNKFFAHGKLMLTGEYFVLEGAKALAFPTKKGQSLQFISNSEAVEIEWLSHDHLGKVWFETQIDCKTLRSSNQNEIGQKLQEILKKSRDQNPDFLKEGGKVQVNTDFNLQWGFGSSSTLISVIAQWAKIDAFELQRACFGGSGYDIACATAKGPIVFQKAPIPTIIEVNFNPYFKDWLYFVYLGKKQNSRTGIKHFKSLEIAHKQSIIGQLNAITQAILNNASFEAFCSLLKEHEQIISNSLHMPMVQEQLFPDFNGQVKSLGAWGGDFVLAACNEPKSRIEAYFKEKGLHTILPYSETIV